MPTDVKYTTQATASGGRDGRATTAEGTLGARRSTQKSLEERVRGAPTFYRKVGYDWPDRDEEWGLADHYGILSYRRI